MTNLTKQLQDLLYPYAPNKLSKIEMDTKIIPAIEDLLAEEVEVMYQKGLRDSATDTCSVTGCKTKATTGINNQDYCDKHFEEQRKAVELKLKETTGIDLDKATGQTAHYLYNIDGDCPPELAQAIGTLRRLINEEFKPAKSLSSQFIYDILYPKLLLWADQRAIQIIGEDEKGEIVQVGCPDLNPGCLVLHSEFKMTHEVKARNQLRAELRQAFKGEK